MVRPLLVVSLSLWLSLSLCRGVVSVFSAHDAHFLSNDIPKSGGSFKSCLWGNFQRGENKFLHLPRVLYSILSYIDAFSRFTLSLSLSLFKRAQVVSDKEQKASLFSKLFSGSHGKHSKGDSAETTEAKTTTTTEQWRPLPPPVNAAEPKEGRSPRDSFTSDFNGEGRATTSYAPSPKDHFHSTQAKTRALNGMKKAGEQATSTKTKMSAETKRAIKSSREAKFRNYLNVDGTLDKLTRALDDLLRSNVKPESPSDWLVARLSEDYGNKLREAQEDLEEQVKENEKLKEKLEKSRRFVHRLQEDVEDLTKKLQEEKEMAEAVAARAMHEPQEVEMLKEELREVMEDANEMADLIREYEQREEERLALRSAKKELQGDRERYGDGNVPSSRSSDASSTRLMRFEEIKEKVRRQHEEAQRYIKQNGSGRTSPTASELSSQYMDDDAPRLMMSPSKRITESEGKLLF